MPPLPSAQDSRSSTPSPSTFLAAWLCTVTGLGCPAAQVRPQPGDECPPAAAGFMFNQLGMDEDSELTAITDIHQPDLTRKEPAVVQEGPIISKLLSRGAGDPRMLDGLLLYGHLWAGPEIKDQAGNPSIIIRYTEALLPDDRKVSVCLIGGDSYGRIPLEEGSRPGALFVRRAIPVHVVVRRFP